MAVRLAVPADIPRIVPMVEALVEASGMPLAVDREWTAQSLLALIAGRNSAVWISDGGFLAGRVVRTLISPEPVAVEDGWYATDRSGIRLLRAFEQWAGDMGATKIRLSTGQPGPDLARLGYRPVELAWVR